MTEAPGLRLVRWTVASGSSVTSRAAVVLEAGDHRWEARGVATGPVAALYRAVDKALGDVLGGHPRLLAYDVHAVEPSPDAQAAVAVRIGGPDGSEATYPGGASDENVIAASVLAYVAALDAMLADPRFSGATEARGNRRAATDREAAARRQARGAELDEEAAEDAGTNWFDR